MLLSWLLATGLSVLLYSSGIFSLFAPLPLAVLSWRRGPLVATASALCGGLLLFGLYHFAGPVMAQGGTRALFTLPLMPLVPLFSLPQITFLGVLEFSYYGVLGLLLVRGTRFKRLEWGMLSVLLGGALVLTLGVLLFSQIFHISFLGKTYEVIQGMFEQWAQVNAGSDGNGEDAGLIKKEYMPLFADTFYYLLPAFFVNGTLISSALNLMILRRWIRQDKAFAWGDFGQWRLPEGWVWFPIGAGGGYFLNHFLFHQVGVQWFSLNLLLINALIYFFQGTAILSFFWRRSFSPWIRLVAYFLFFILFQIVAVIIALTGLFDFWFDFRKLKRNSTSVT